MQYDCNEKELKFNILNKLTVHNLFKDKKKCSMENVTLCSVNYLENF